jgi:hypothetical protein
MAEELSSDLRACLGQSWFPRRRHSNSNRQLDVTLESTEVNPTVEVRSTTDYQGVWEMRLEVNVD